MTSAPRTKSRTCTSSCVRYTETNPSWPYHKASVQIPSTTRTRTTRTPRAISVGISAPRRRRRRTTGREPRTGSDSKLTGGELTQRTCGSPRRLCSGAVRGSPGDLRGRRPRRLRATSGRRVVPPGRRAARRPRARAARGRRGVGRPDPPLRARPHGRRAGPRPGARGPAARRGGRRRRGRPGAHHDRRAGGPAAGVDDGATPGSAQLAGDRRRRRGGDRAGRRPARGRGAVPPDPDEAVTWLSQHPSRREVRLAVAILRDGTNGCAVRARDHDRDVDVAVGPDLVPGPARGPGRDPP